MFDKIKRYYEMGLYKTVHIEKLLSVGAITQAQFDEIVKENENEQKNLH